MRDDDDDDDEYVMRNEEKGTERVVAGNEVLTGVGGSCFLFLPRPHFEANTSIPRPFSTPPPLPVLCLSLLSGSPEWWAGLGRGLVVGSR